jgi:hypothetical protein
MWHAVKFMGDASDGCQQCHMQTYGAIEDKRRLAGIFTNGVHRNGGGTVLSANEESRSVSGWVLGATNGTQITFGARLKRYGNALHLGTGTMQRVSITAF